MQRRRVVAHISREKWALLNGLRVLWVVVVLWCESGVFLWSLLSCHWPDHDLLPHAPLTHVLLVADPQILDHHSYPGRPSWLMTLTLYIVDFNIRKSWNAVITKLDPDVVIFLGDMMDNGRADMNDDEYARYYGRFKSIFRLDTSIPVYYIPGNHDVGLGAARGHSPLARDRYQQHFGTLNQRLEISNHTFLLIDAPGLVDEDYFRRPGDIRDGEPRRGGAMEFLQEFSKQRPNGPVVLLSHIPLFRPNHSSCGPLREKGTIRPGAGHGYLNVLLRETSMLVLESTHPTVIFSGDDHDYCEYVHTLGDGSKVREVTIKSFSMAMGIQRPGFQLLSLSSATNAINQPSSAHSPVMFADVGCVLPNQIKIYTHVYAPFAILTVLFISVFNFRHRVSRFPVERPGLFSWILRVLWSSTPTHHRTSLPAHSSVGGRSTLSWSHRDEESLDLDDMRPIADTIEDSNLLYGPPGPRARYSFNSDYRDMSLTPKNKGSCIGDLLSRVRHALWPSEGGQCSWHMRAMRDLWRIASPPIFLYTIISVWTFWL